MSARLVLVLSSLLLLQALTVRRAVNGAASAALGLLIAQGPLSRLIGASASGGEFPVRGSEEIMAAKGHGTSERPVMDALRWSVDPKLADRISNYNRHWAEGAGYFQQTRFLSEVSKDAPTTFYDSVTGRPLFVAPVGRSFEDFKRESTSHGWPSFRDNEVVWENVRVLPDGETVSLTGTHLGHNLPDLQGNRYCINLVSVAGAPQEADKSAL